MHWQIIHLKQNTPKFKNVKNSKVQNALIFSNFMFLIFDCIFFIGSFNIIVVPKSLVKQQKPNNITLIKTWIRWKKKTLWNCIYLLFLFFFFLQIHLVLRMATFLYCISCDKMGKEKWERKKNKRNIRNITFEMWSIKYWCFYIASLPFIESIICTSMSSIQQRFWSFVVVVVVNCCFYLCISNIMKKKNVEWRPFDVFFFFIIFYWSTYRLMRIES